ncbi:MAG: hypothetical protein F9K16_03355 [Thermoanaerobaculia bacterium]|nr:MAG: hypothetical protein F9K16_03355 [Thermoanaerobaculia bacterium]MBZ0103353.1 hypothetical protein [Thermoanaerobaculia bacterium]
MARPPRDPAASAGLSIRITGFAMIAGVMAFAAISIAVAPEPGPAAPPQGFVWGLAALALLLLVGGLALGRGGERKRILPLALCEGCGLNGSVLTLLTGNPAWAAALGGLAIAALILGLAGDGGPTPGLGRSA